MFDERMRWLKDGMFNPLAGWVSGWRPWVLSAVGLVCGLVGAWAFAFNWYLAGLILWFLNRLFDGLDGSVARLYDKKSDLGGYVDIMFDFIVYAAIPVGLLWGAWTELGAVALIFMLCTFYVNGASWMYLAAILEKRRAANPEQLTTVVMPAGLVGAIETFIFYTLFMVWPGYLAELYIVFGLLVVVTVGQRFWWAVRMLA
ncbi:MAG TPA: CDP-alcohol phosphatidyltransferase family protein [Anaerolineae bacterium]|nr:CDP-alcohol phosphatidyltransferase family protein [Anaerolineae bacterium]